MGPLLLVPLAIAVALRFWGLGWGLPQVYEEAYPFKKAWDMWGWGPSDRLDLNPHFFNYPTLYFYVQFLGQGLLLAFLKLTRQVASILDYRVLYELDKTSFYLLGRSISALCGIATVAATFVLARRVAGAWAGGIAAFLVAVNQTHITKSQFIEVDVPLTLLSTLCMLFSLRISAHGARRDYVLAGLCGGLGASTKYNGALLALAIVVAHVIALRQKAKVDVAPSRGRTPAVPAKTRPPFTALVLSGVVFAAAFLLTSPYVLLDRAAFWTGFNYERMHMRVGHFGQEDVPTIVWYMRNLTGSLLGWPLALLGLAGFVWFALVRRRAWACVLGVFPVVYLIVLSSWSMRAERYMIPLLPLAATFAAAFVIEQLPRVRAWGRHAPALVAVVSALVMAAPSVRAAVRERGRLRGDTRTISRQWVDENVPAGSLLVIEAYGPEPLGIIDVQNWSDDIRQRVLDSRPDIPIYPVLVMPMFQVRSENTAIFYDLRLYEPIADLIITSSSVMSRYRKNPSLYAAHVAFYDQLESTWIRRKEFGPQDGSGPHLTVWANPNNLPPFASRRPPAVPPPPAMAPDLLPGSFTSWFERLAFDYEGYSFHDGATALNLMGLRYPDQPPELQRVLLLGAIRNLLSAGRRAQALAVVAEAESRLKRDAQLWRRIREQIQTAAVDTATTGRP